MGGVESWRGEVMRANYVHTCGWLMWILVALEFEGHWCVNWRDGIDWEGKGAYG